MSCTEINISNYCMSVGSGIRSCTCKNTWPVNFLKILLLYSGCEIPRGLKYAISKYGNMCKRYMYLTTAATRPHRQAHWEGGRWGYFPGARTNRGPGAFVNANVVVICLYCITITIHFVLPKCIKLHHFQVFLKFFFLGENPQTPLHNKTKVFMQHNMT